MKRAATWKEWIAGFALLLAGQAWAAEEAAMAAKPAAVVVEPAAAAAPTVKDAPAAEARDTPRTAEEMVMAPLPEEEKTLYEIVQKAFQGGDSGGAAALKGRKPMDLPVRVAAYLALMRNLDIRVSAHEAQFLEAAKLEAQAALLPVIDLTARYDVDATYNRKRTAIVATKLIPFRVPPSIAFPAPSPITRIDFLPGRAPGTKLGFQFASKRGTNGPVRKGTFTFSLSQLLPWGASYNLTATMVHKNAYADRFFHNYEAPWTTTMTASVTLPIPFTKNFGPFAPQDTAIKLAHVDSERAVWDLREAINVTLATVDLAYWDLVDRLKVLENTMENRKTLESLADKVAQLLAAGRSTAYGKDQVDDEVLRVKNLEELAWNDYIAASNVLVNLLDLDPHTVLIPHGYSLHVKEHLAIKTEEAVSTGLANRPLLQAEALNTKASEINVQFRKQQKKPDLTFTTSGSLVQSNAEAGYRDLGKSFKNIFRADARNQADGMTYVYALGQRAEKAALSEARSRLEEQKLTYRLAENQVAWDINDALSAIEAARGQVAAAQVRLDAAKKTNSLAREMKEAGRLTDFEVITRSQQWLDALNAHVAANIEYKKAETRLLAAEGTLLSFYPEMTAHTDFERYRAELLRTTQTLQLFKTGTGTGKGE